jgi:hypothetical protein
MFKNDEKFAYLYDFYLPEVRLDKPSHELFNVGVFGSYTTKHYESSRNFVRKNALSFTQQTAIKELAKLLAFILAVLIVGQAHLALSLAAFALVNVVYVLYYRKYFSKAFVMRLAITTTEYFVVLNKKKPRKKSIALAEQAIPVPEPVKPASAKKGFTYCTICNIVVSIGFVIAVFATGSYDPAYMTKTDVVLMGIYLFVMVELFFVAVFGSFVLCRYIYRRIVRLPNKK